MNVIKHYMISGVVTVVIAISAYYWGYLCGKQGVDSASYDQAIMSLSNNILIYDSIVIDKSKEIKPVIISSIESDFAKMVELYQENQFKQAEGLRCAISRRFRVLKQKNEILFNPDAVVEYPLMLVSNYLDKECMGEPSHANWLLTEGDQAKGDVQE